MKAAVVENAGQLVVRELPEPPMGDYEARCEMLYGSVCAGTDTHLLHFHVPFCYWMQMPFILGHESVGRVVDTGEKVRHLKPGDLITRVGSPAVGGIHSGWGGFATTGMASDWRAMQEDGIDGWKDKTVQQILPPDVDPAVGTLFITWRETLSYMMRMGIGKAKRWTQDPRWFRDCARHGWPIPAQRPPRWRPGRQPGSPSASSVPSPSGRVSL